LEKNPYIYSQLIFNKHIKTHTHIEERRVSSINGAMETGYPYAKE
jgi:hypothetical protein